MANFNMHLSGAVIGSGILATFCYNAQLADANHCVTLWVTGALAGLLPDVDSNNSSSLKVIFNTLAMMIGALVVVRMSGHYALVWTALSVFVAWLALRWIALPIFKKITVHRGGWHTLLTGACISMFMINITWHAEHVTASYAWLLGIFTAAGFMIHLILDEMYSFDLSNMRIKKSFGTAIKPINTKTPIYTGLVAIMTILQLWYLPPWQSLTSASHNLFALHII